MRREVPERDSLIWVVRIDHPEIGSDSFGFDVQQSAQDGSALIAFLERLGAGSGDPRVTDIQACDGVGTPTVWPAAVTDARNQQCLHGLAAAEQLIDQEAGQHAAGISPQDLD